jgi:hypothetical protein
MKKIILILTILFGLNSCNYVAESSVPTKYLKAGGSYNENFWGDKLKIHGTISNSAKSATYKDVVIKVTYLTKTNTELHSLEYTIYDYFPPNSVNNFELRIDNYSNAEKLSWEVVNAKSE